MLRLRSFFQRQLLRSGTCRQCSLSSKQKSSGESEVSSDTQSADLGAAAASQKLRARAPLVKNFFIGVVDKELLAFPEVIARDEMKQLQEDIAPLQDFFSENVNVKEVFTQLQQLNVFANNVPIDYDGKGWNYSGSLMATQIEAQNTDIALSLMPHRLVVDVLNEFGTLEQQQRFMPQLANGKLIGTDAIFEYEATNDGFFNTCADYQPENKTWLLNGEKAFVISGNFGEKVPTLYLVLAQTNRLGVHDHTSFGITAFLVDSQTPGLSIGAAHSTIGTEGVKKHRLQLKNVCVPDWCVVGSAHDASPIAEALLRSNRLRTSMVALGLAKSALSTITDICIRTRQSGVEISEMESVKLRLSRAMCDIYGMESLIYFTAGLHDEFNKQDIALEASIAKYFSVTKLLELAKSCLDVFGVKAVSKENPIESIYRNATQLYAQNEAIESLQLYIALSGLQHAGKYLGEDVAKTRNPLFHPGHVLSKYFQSSNIDQPRTKLRLGDNLHPTLGPGAQCLEQSVARLHMATENLLTKFGHEILERHGELERLAKMTVDIYAMFASLSRASRSYCIGLQYADHELLTASTLAMMGHHRVKIECEQIFNGHYQNGDNNLLRLSNRILQSKGPFDTHPLTFNF